jgi:hypothetical protein
MLQVFPSLDVRTCDHQRVHLARSTERLLEAGDLLLQAAD